MARRTLVNVIAGLLPADSGDVALDDSVLLDTDLGINVPPERRRIGYVFQDARLFPHLRVESNLRYALKRAAVAPFVSVDRVVQLLDLEPLMNRRTHALSGGERQRVAIGRALLSQPSLLLLDEPLASLDASRREEVLPYLETLRDQLAIPMVYVSHNFDEVLRLATHLVLMEAGKTIAQGDLGEMSLHPRVREIIGTDAVGAIVDGRVLGTDSSSGLTRVQVGRGELKVQCGETAPGMRLRVQLLARDLIVATEAPRQLSVRNSLPGVVTSVANDVDDSDLIAHRYRRHSHHGASHQGRYPRIRSRPGETGMGAGEDRVLASARYLTAVPRCRMATMWSSAANPTAALTLALYAAGPVFHIAPIPNSVAASNKFSTAAPAAITCSISGTLGMSFLTTHPATRMLGERLIFSRSSSICSSVKPGFWSRRDCATAFAKDSRSAPLTATKRQGLRRPWSGACPAASRSRAICVGVGPGPVSDLAVERDAIASINSMKKPLNKNLAEIRPGRPFALGYDLRPGCRSGSPKLYLYVLRSLQ